MSTTEHPTAASQPQPAPRRYIGDGVYITAEAGELVLETYRAEPERTEEGYRNWLALGRRELTAMGAYLALTDHMLALQIAQHMVAVATHQASVESKATLQEIGAVLEQLARKR
jgi:hypothetical protein